MRVAIHQPQYWPWPPYIHKAMSCDTFVYLDTVQFSKNGLQNRNRIKTPQGAVWLTLPVRHHFGQRLLETQISDPRALSRHWKTLEANYARTRGFARWSNELRAFFESRDDSLCEIAIASTEWILEAVGVRSHRVRASAIPGVHGRGSALLASICASLGATEYFAGGGSAEYMRGEDFAKIECRVWIQERRACVYEQAFPEKGFVPDLSALDLVLNCPETAARDVMNAGAWKVLWDAQ